MRNDGRKRAPIAGGSHRCRAGWPYRPSRAGLSYTPHPVVIAAFTQRLCALPALPKSARPCGRTANLSSISVLARRLKLTRP
jgi:hypothetical protein